MDAPCNREEMRACLRDLAWTNLWTLAYRPQMHWLNTLADELSLLAVPIRILDVACGYGDGLRRIEQWAHKRGIAVELIGLELNPDATVIASEATPASSRIRWVTADVFAYEPQHPVHLVISSLFTIFLRTTLLDSCSGWSNMPGWDGLSTIYLALRFLTISSNSSQSWQGSIPLCSMTVPSQ